MGRAAGGVAVRVTILKYTVLRRAKKPSYVAEQTIPD